MDRRTTGVDRKSSELVLWGGARGQGENKVSANIVRCGSGWDT